MTPEGKIKAAIKRLLAKYKHYGWWPVPCGYGQNSLDWIGCINGKFVAVEAKAPGKKLTPLQWSTFNRIKENKGEVFVIDGLESLEQFRRFLDNLVGAHS